MLMAFNDIAADVRNRVKEKLQAAGNDPYRQYLLWKELGIVERALEAIDRWQADKGWEQAVSSAAVARIEVFHEAGEYEMALDACDAAAALCDGSDMLNVLEHRSELLRYVGKYVDAIDAAEQLIQFVWPRLQSESNTARKRAHASALFRSLIAAGSAALELAIEGDHQWIDRAERYYQDAQSLAKTHLKRANMVKEAEEDIHAALADLETLRNGSDPDPMYPLEASANQMSAQIRLETFQRVPLDSLQPHEAAAVHAALRAIHIYLSESAQSLIRFLPPSTDAPTRLVEKVTLQNVAETVALGPKLRLLLLETLPDEDDLPLGMNSHHEAEEYLLGLCRDEIEWRTRLALRISEIPLVWNICARARSGAGDIDAAIEASLTAWHLVEQTLQITDETSTAPRRDDASPFDFGFTRSPCFENYLEARMRLAHLLVQKGKLREAFAHYRHMYRWSLEVDTRDSCDHLLKATNCAMQLNDAAALEPLLSWDHSDHTSAKWSAANAWVQWKLSGPKSAAAKQARAHLLQQNEHIPLALTLYFMAPDRPRIGSWTGREGEAYYYAEQSISGWEHQERCISWLNRT